MRGARWLRWAQRRPLRAGLELRVHARFSEEGLDKKRPELFYKVNKNRFKGVE